MSLVMPALACMLDIKEAPGQLCLPAVFCLPTIYLPVHACFGRRHQSSSLAAELVAAVPLPLSFDIPVGLSWASAGQQMVPEQLLLQLQQPRCHC